MSAHANVGDGSIEMQRPAPVSIPATRLMLWSARREFWEHRSLYVAPLAVAAVALLGFSISSLLGIWEKPLRLNADQPQAPFELAAALMMLTAIVVSVFYCLDALHSERRDRSILFWKSLPVSDATTVLAKASIPLVLLPLLIFAVTVALHCLMLLLSTIVVLATGQSVATLWTNVSLFRMSWLMLYHLVTAHALWPAPIYCWLLLVGGWSRRATLLWAVLPLAAIAVVEQFAFHTWHFARMVASRLLGDAPTVLSTGATGIPIHSTTHISPSHFLSSPGLWIGLGLAGVFLAAAVRVRRDREPI
jgi:ABC-2 type transport system permease protein